MKIEKLWWSYIMPALIGIVSFPIGIFISDSFFRYIPGYDGGLTQIIFLLLLTISASAYYAKIRKESIPKSILISFLALVIFFLIALPYSID